MMSHLFNSVTYWGFCRIQVTVILDNARRSREEKALAIARAFFLSSPSTATLRGDSSNPRVQNSSADSRQGLARSRWRRHLAGGDVALDDLVGVLLALACGCLREAGKRAGCWGLGGGEGVAWWAT
jgi:hypothetical protein